MAMTASVKDELSRLNVTKTCCRKAEMAALLRFAGGLHLVAGKIVVEAELDTGSTARRLRKEIRGEWMLATPIKAMTSRPPVARPQRALGHRSARRARALRSGAAPAPAPQRPPATRRPDLQVAASCGSS